MAAFNDIHPSKRDGFRKAAARILISWGVPAADAFDLADFEEPDGRDQPGQFAKSCKAEWDRKHAA